MEPNQGSVFGPVLFIIYNNDICSMYIDSKTIMYTDDTCLLFSSHTWENIKRKIAVKVHKVFKKLSELKLFLNINKNVFVAFTIANSYVPVDDIIICYCDTRNVLSNYCDCQIIIRVTRVKYLGLIIDWNLRWNIHFVIWLCV